MFDVCCAGIEDEIEEVVVWFACPMATPSELRNTPEWSSSSLADHRSSMNYPSKYSLSAENQCGRLDPQNGVSLLACPLLTDRRDKFAHRFVESKGRLRKQP